MAGSCALSFARRALPIKKVTDDGTRERELAAGARGLPRHGRIGAPRQPKRWRLFVGNGATSAFFRETPSEHAAPPPQPARGRTQSF
jgi:hypothetical protein